MATIKDYAKIDRGMLIDFIEKEINDHENLMGRNPKEDEYHYGATVALNALVVDIQNYHVM